MYFIVMWTDKEGSRQSEDFPSKRPALLEAYKKIQQGGSKVYIDKMNDDNDLEVSWRVSLSGLVESVC